MKKMDCKVLIIDDSEQDRKGIAIALKKGGFTDLNFAENAQQGIEKVKSLSPDVVVIDVVLPSTLGLDDGIDVCNQIKKVEKSTAKIIIITGHLEAVDAGKARTCGADELVPKEAGFANIGSAIQQLIA